MTVDQEPRMNTIRALIIDDERLARAEMLRLLVAHEQVEVVGQASNIDQAEQLINALQPDLLFLDIQMPGGSGFDLLERLPHSPAVIFTTAFDAYALKAFEVNALDYLQKPIEPGRLSTALERVGKQLKEPAAVTTATPEPAATPAAKPLSQDHRIFIKDGERCWFVALADITLFESEGNYTRVYFQNNRPLILRSLNQLEERLSTQHFFRASRKHIVNLQHIQAVKPNASEGLDLTMSNGVTVDVSRRRAAEFKDATAL